ncbi:MAG TPA: hypothetical protein VHM64_14265 [Candidatus Binatia bacterium]|nr:hypothetical protein [Candidatus Binatia bacterium]
MAIFSATPPGKSTRKATFIRLVGKLDSLITGKAVGVLFLVIFATWGLYGLVGHSLIETMYRSTTSHILMAGKSTTPLEAYLDAGDRMLVITTVSLLAASLLLVLVIKTPLGSLYGFAAVAALSFLVFCLVEVFPAIGNSLRLDQIGYHYFHNLYIADDQLVHKLKPHLRMTIPAFGHEYPPMYGIQVQSRTIEWITDEDGFRNGDPTRSDDMLIIGDGFIEEGNDLSDTFAGRIEELAAIKTRNLGTGGYGPFQYLEVLKRYGLKRNPKFALIAFNEVNDVFDIEKYLEWKEGKEEGLEVLYDARTPVVTKTFFGRYIGVLAETSHYIQKVAFTTAQVLLDKLNTHRQNPAVHPDVVMVEIGKQAKYKMLFIDKLTTESSEELLASDTGRRLKKILIDFKTLCERNNIIPIIMFVPSAAHIYAQYSTEASGRNWRKIRSEQIAAKANVERAISNLARDLRIELINLSSVFESAAQSGRMLYYPLSSHWNAEGREVAAEFVADVLKSKFTSSAAVAEATQG